MEVKTRKSKDKGWFVELFDVPKDKIDFGGYIEYIGIHTKYISAVDKSSAKRIAREVRKIFNGKAYKEEK